MSRRLQLVELVKQIEQLTKENDELRARLKILPFDRPEVCATCTHFRGWCVHHSEQVPQNYVCDDWKRA